MGAQDDVEGYKEAIKSLLKKRGRTYSWLAEELGISESTMKRILNQEELSMSRFCAVARALALTPVELMRLAAEVKPPVQYYSEEEERFFIGKLRHWNYLLQLGMGRTPTELGKEFGLAPERTREMLADLEGAGFIKVYPGRKVKVLKPQIVALNPCGETVRDVFSTLFRECNDLVERKFLEKSLRGGFDERESDVFCMHLHLQKLSLSSCRKFREELNELLRRYDEMAVFERKVLPKEQLLDVMASFGFVIGDDVSEIVRAYVNP